MTNLLLQYKNTALYTFIPINNDIDEIIFLQNLYFLEKFLTLSMLMHTIDK